MMISLLKAIEFVISMYVNRSGTKMKQNYTRKTIQLRILSERKKSRRSILCRSTKHHDSIEVSSKQNGFPLDSDFGWNINLINDNDSQKCMTSLKSTEGSSLINLNACRTKMNHPTNEKNESAKRILNKKKRHRHALQQVVQHPSWNWTESYLLKTLVICAQDDPDASKALSLDIAEADEESKWKELGKARIEFLRSAGSINERLRLMKEEVNLMRRYAEDADKEIKKEDLKVKDMKKEVQRLSSEMLEVICADMMLEKISTMSLNLKSVHYPKYTFTDSINKHPLHI